MGPYGSSFFGMKQPDTIGRMVQGRKNVKSEHLKHSVSNAMRLICVSQLWGPIPPRQSAFLTHMS